MKLIGFIFIFLFTTNTVSAGGLSITEIMYDLPGSDSGREWIEIYNNTGASIDLTKYKFFESGTSHNISHYEGDIELANGAYAVISDNATNFLNDNPNFPKTNLYDSSFSLSNDKGENLAIKDSDGNILYEVSYDVSLGANGDGNTLQLNSSGFWASMGISVGSSLASNTTIKQETQEESKTNNTEIVNRGGSNFVPYKKDPAMKFEFQNPKTNLVGHPTLFKANLFGFVGESITNGYFVWNFGDGETIALTTNQEVDHIYLFPGIYTVSLSYKYSSWYPKPTIVGKTKIEIVEPSLVLKDLYLTPFPAVRISNNNDFEYDISKYIIQTHNQNIIIPEGTYIGAKDDIVFRLPQGSYSKDSIKLLSFSGYTVYSTFSPKETINVAKPTPVYKPVESNFYNLTSDQVVQNDELVFDLDQSVDDEPKSNLLKYIIFFGVMLISSFLVIIIRFKNLSNTKDEDYILQDE